MFGRLVDTDKDGLASKEEIKALMVSFPFEFVEKNTDNTNLFNA